MYINKLRFEIVSIIGACFFIIAIGAQAQMNDVSNQQNIFDEVEQPNDFRMDDDYSFHQTKLDAIKEVLEIGDENNIQNTKPEGKLHSFGLMEDNDSNRPNIDAGLGFAKQQKKARLPLRLAMSKNVSNHQSVSCFGVLVKTTIFFLNKRTSEASSVQGMNHRISIFVS